MILAAVGKKRLTHLTGAAMAFGIAFTAADVRADEVHFDLRLTIHDYGRLVASTRACNMALDSEGLKQSILDIARTSENLDADAISKTMDATVQEQGRRIPGCSRAAMQIARAHLDRDLTDFKDAVANQ